MLFIKSFSTLLLGVDFLYLILYVPFGFFIHGFTVNSHCKQSLLGNIVIDSLFNLIIFSLISLVTIPLLFLIGKLLHQNIFYSNRILSLFIVTSISLIIELLIITILSDPSEIPFIMFWPSNSCY